MVMLNVLKKQPQPITMLFEICQKDGKQLDVKHWMKGEILSSKSNLTFEYMKLSVRIVLGGARAIAGAANPTAADQNSNSK
ncbi:hypothetical protein Tco_0692082 [Tanacetum coccineum]